MAKTKTVTPAQLAMAKRMINASICAYQIHENQWKPSGPQPPVLRRIQAQGYFYNVVPRYQDAVGFVGTAASGYAPLFVATGRNYINAALVGAMNDGNLVLSLRGTIPPSTTNNDIKEWIEDWIQDLDLPPTPWSIIKGPFSNVANVETGFATSMLSLWPAVKSMIDQTLKIYQCTGVVITGHSKGAAASFLAATLIAQAYPKLKANIQVHAFAPPVAGDAGFKKLYASMGLSAATHRYQVENDVVPFLPLWPNANIFTSVQFPTWEEQAAWDLLYFYIFDETKGGYDAVGDFTYFNASHKRVPGAVVQSSALPAVASTISAGKVSTVAAAHSAVSSYLPCF